MKNRKRTNDKKKGFAFSIVELVGALAIIGIVAAIALPVAHKATKASKESKLTNEVASLNRAVLVYKSSGGSLDRFTTPQEVIDAMKTARSLESAKRYVGFTGSLVDARVECIIGHADEHALCAVWNADEQKFELARGGNDVVTSFALNGGEITTTEDREDSLVQYGDKGWIWDYDPQNLSNRTSQARTSAPSLNNRGTLGANANPSGATGTGNLITGIATPDITIPAQTGPGIGEDGILEIHPCIPPTFLITAGEYAKDRFPLACPILNPNGLNGKCYYKIVGKHDEWQEYTENFYCDPNDTVVAYVKATGEYYTDSQQVTCTYTSDNQAPICKDDECIINVVYNSHLFSGNQEAARYGVEVQNFDQGTTFDNNASRETLFAPCDNDTDPDGDPLKVCAIRAEKNQLPIETVINKDGSITFIPTTNDGILGYRYTRYIDFSGGSLEDDAANNQYDEFWKDIASVYSWRRSEEGDNVGNRVDANGNFTATDTYEYVACDDDGATDVGEIVCRVQELTVLSPIAIDTDGSGAIELTSGVQSFDFTGNGSDEQVKGWFAGNDGILVDAQYGDDINGEHLFGDMGGRYSDGFAKLSQRDEDNNGVINGSELSDLKLWFDNGNAQLDAGELRSISEFGINQISLNHSDYVSDATTTDGVKLHVEDIWFPVHN